jgi:hypothetical protein
MRLLLFALLAVQSAVAQQSAPDATVLEAFAARPSAEPVLARLVGSIESADAQVRVTALHLEDAQHASQHMHGVRFDLQNNAGADQVYLDSDQLKELKRELAGIQSGIPLLESDDSAPYRVQGTGACWNPRPNIRILCPDYYVGPDRAGMRLAALGGRSFAFPNHQPAELIELIERASEAIRQSVDVRR